VARVEGVRRRHVVGARRRAAGRGPGAAALTRDDLTGSVVDVARDLIGCTIRHGATAGVIVETEAYHESEPACHAYIGRTARTVPLFGRAGTAYVYFSYGMHALLNVVCEREGVGAAVLIRALEPLEGLDLMRARRDLERREDLCSGPGKLTQALGIELDLNGSDLIHGPITIEPPPADWPPAELLVGPRIGITKAAELPWRFSAAGFRSVSKPWPPGLRDTVGPRAFG
jgi:DNA-3-methyladenine glycosylase